MSEKAELIVVDMVDEEISTKFQLCPEDYSKVYTLQLFKQDYKKDTKEWVTDAETTQQYDADMKELGNPSVGDKVNVFVSNNGKAYLTEKTFVETVKPSGKDANKLFTNCEIESFHDSPKGRRVIVKYKKNFYEFSFNYSVWIPSIEKYVPNDAKMEKAKVRFNDIFEHSLITWENALETDADGVSIHKGVKMNCLVRKNELDATGQTGWVEPLKIDEPDVDEDELPF